MKKFIIIIMVIILAGCSNKAEFLPESNNDSIITYIGKGANEKDKALEMVEKMSLEEKVGQIFMVMPEVFDDSGNVTTVFDNSFCDKMEEYNVGGIILFAKNIVAPEQTKNLINKLQENSKYPMFIAVDEEGGRVARVGKNENMGVAQIEPMGQVTDSKRAYEIGETIGKYLSELGFNLDFAPVADVLIDINNTEIGDRSFGSDPVICGEMAAQVVKGLQNNGVSAALKHFPGHGGFESNSHEGLSESDRSLEEMRNNEFIPFKYGIEGGSDFVMVAHMSLPNITGESTPATLSPYIITDLLKGELGFKGVVVSDALNMGAVADYYGAEEAAVKALNAGVDMLLMPENLYIAYNAVIEAVNKGDVSMERLNDAVYNILSIKIKRGIIN